MKRLYYLMATFAIVLSGCALQKPMEEVKQWRLLPQRNGEPRVPQTAAWLTQGNIAVVAPFDTKSWVFMVDQARFQKDFYNEYISMPGEMIATATRLWIDRAGIFKFVNTNNNSLPPSYVLQGNVEELMMDIRGEPQVSMRITYLLTNNLERENPIVFRKTYSSSTRIELPRQSKDILQAQEKALANILTELEIDLWEVGKTLQNKPVKLGK